MQNLDLMYIFIYLCIIIYLDVSQNHLLVSDEYMFTLSQGIKSYYYYKLLNALGNDTINIR